MPTFLDQLAAEWYSYKEGYFVRMNVPLRKRERGGHEGDADVIGLRLKDNKIQVIHIENSQAAQSFEEHLQALKKKFEKAANNYENIVGCKCDKVFKVGICTCSKKKGDVNKKSDIEVYTTSEFLKMITKELNKIHPGRSGVPETFPMLRAIQFILHYGIEKI